MSARRPYIPLYIGDWEQDTNCLSIEAEGAWLKVVFKCWRNGGVYTATQESLARLCKSTPEKFASILLEWKTNKICEITGEQSPQLTITSRRIKREAEISAKKAENGRKGGQAKRKQTPKQNPSKLLKYDNDIDNDNDNEIDISLGKSENPFLPKAKNPLDLESRLKDAFDDLYLDQQKTVWPHLDFMFQFRTFCEKVRGSPGRYAAHTTEGLRLALQRQLREAKPTTSHGKDDLLAKAAERIVIRSQGK